MASQGSVTVTRRFLNVFRSWYYNAAGFNKYGLMYEDTLDENPVVKEAIRRLPENIYNDRVFRMKRALDLSLKHQILPKDQWTKIEDEKAYLSPYIQEVQRELKEKNLWEKK